MVRMIPETQAQECARRFATTPETRARELANLADYRDRETERALAEFDKRLRQARPWALSGEGSDDDRQANRAWHGLLVGDACRRVRDRLSGIGAS